GRYFEVTRLAGLDHSQTVKPDTTNHPGYLLLRDFFSRQFRPLVQNHRKKAAAQTKLEAAYADLQKISAATELALNEVRLAIEAARASADTAARLKGDPELKRLGEELRQATDRFDAQYRGQQTSEMVLGVRLARARAAVAEGRYSEAQDMVTDADVAAQ